VDDFLVFTASHHAALQARDFVASLLHRLGLARHPSKGLWHPVQYGQHLGIDIDTATGTFYAPTSKLTTLARQAKAMLQRTTRCARWLPVKELLQFASRAEYLFLAIPAARFYLHDLHCVVGGLWSRRVRMTPRLRRDLQWWTDVPNIHNGRPIHKPVESAFLHCDSSSYGCGATHGTPAGFGPRRTMPGASRGKK
jgi:hypothetical protein